MAKQYNIIPSPITIDNIIEKYNIEGEDKRSLIRLKEALSENLKDKDSILIELNNENYKKIINILL